MKTMLPNLRYYSSICLERLKKIMITLVIIACIQAKI